jgi:hypothetical protein
MIHCPRDRATRQSGAAQDPVGGSDTSQPAVSLGWFLSVDRFKTGDDGYVIIRDKL